MSHVAATSPPHGGLKRSVAYNSLIQLVGRVVGLLFTIATGRILTAGLGQAWGEYGTVTVYLGVVGFCADAGLTTICAREMARDEARGERILGNTLALRLLLGLVLVPLAILVAFLVYSAPRFAVLRSGIVAASFLLPLQLLNLSLTPVFQVRQRMVYPVVADLVVRGVQWAALVTLAGNGRLDLHSALTTLWLSAGVGLLMNGAAARRLIRLRLYFELPYWWRLLLTALPLGIGGILSSLYFRIDMLMLRGLQPVAVAGAYRLATSVYDYSLYIPTVFITAAFPVLVGQIALGHDRVRTGIQQSFDFLVLMGVPIAAGAAVLAPRVMQVLTPLPALQLAGAEPARILVTASAVSYLTSLLAYLLVAIDRQRDVLVVNAAILAANVGLNLVFIPRWSMVGAAWATLITESISLVGLSLFVRRRYGFYPSLAKVPRVFLAAGVMATALGWLYAHGVPFRLLCVIGVTLYGALALALGLVDRALLAQILRRRPPTGGQPPSDGAEVELASASDTRS